MKTDKKSLRSRRAEPLKSLKNFLYFRKVCAHLRGAECYNNERTPPNTFYIVLLHPIRKKYLLLKRTAIDRLSFLLATGFEGKMSERLTDALKEP